MIQSKPFSVLQAAVSAVGSGAVLITSCVFEYIVFQSTYLGSFESSLFYFFRAVVEIKGLFRIKNFSWNNGWKYFCNWLFLLDVRLWNFIIYCSSSVLSNTNTKSLSFFFSNVGYYFHWFCGLNYMNFKASQKPATLHFFPVLKYMLKKPSHCRWDL